MNLHEDSEVFIELIAFTATQRGLPQVYIEKDYWVTRALQALSESEHGIHAVFKGGTSLSKAHRLIDRFSEDIDLAIFNEDMGDARRKRCLKQVEKAAAHELTALEDDPRESKGSYFRKTVYQYPRSVDSDVFGQATPELLIEVNAFTKPEPFEKVTMQSYIAEELISNDRNELIDQFKLQSFDINVLSVNRTLTEKIMGVVKDSYQENPVDQLSNRIRHLYDICMILKKDTYRDFVQGDEFSSLCQLCIADEKKGFFRYSDSLQKPLKEAPIFSQFESWSGSLSNTYNGVFADLVYGELPELSDIQESLEFIHSHL